jgi:hypothetical protein
MNIVITEQQYRLILEQTSGINTDKGFNSLPINKTNDKGFNSLPKNKTNDKGFDSNLIKKGFQKWGAGYLMRLPKGSSNTNDAIRILVDNESNGYHVTVSVQSNKKVRSEIKGNNTFKTIESIIKYKFTEDGNWSSVSGTLDSNNLDKVINLLSSLKVDEKNNIFL